MVSCLSTRQCRINLFSAFLYEVIHTWTPPIQHPFLYSKSFSNSPALHT